MDNGACVAVDGLWRAAGMTAANGGVANAWLKRAQIPVGQAACKERSGSVSCFQRDHRNIYARLGRRPGGLGQCPRSSPPPPPSPPVGIPHLLAPCHTARSTRRSGGATEAGNDGVGPRRRQHSLHALSSRTPPPRSAGSRAGTRRRLILRHRRRSVTCL